MLDIIAHIGNVVFSSVPGDLLNFMISEDYNYKKCISLNFDTKKKTIIIDVEKSSEENLSKEALTELLLLPTEKGNRAQYFATSSNIKYIISQTLPNLSKFLPESELKTSVDKVVDEFFIETSKPNDTRVGKIIKIDSFDNITCDYEKSDNPKKLLDNAAKAIENAIEKEHNIKSKETFYTIKIDGSRIVDDKTYRDLLINEFLSTAFDHHTEGICTMCGKKKDVTQNTTRFQFKFYMTDKVSFASEFDKNNYYRAVTLCQDCYKNLVIGEKWVANNLKARLGGFYFYLIPQMLFPAESDKRIIKKLKDLPADFNEIKNVREINKREDQIALQLEKVPFIFNFLFYKKAQSSFKILTLIKDIPPSRLLLINEKINEIGKFMKRAQFPEKFKFDLDQIYWIIPLKKKGADHLEYKKILQIYYNIFSDFTIQKNQLYKHYVELAHMHRFEGYALYQISKQQNPEWSLMSDTLKWNLFILLLHKLDLIGGSTMESKTTYPVPEPLDKAFQELNYSPGQQGLAILGYVLEAAAYAQYKEGLTNKPVMGKLNYQGMTHEKVIRLFNDLFEKVNQYRQHIGYAERWLATAQQLYLSGESAGMTAYERVFYILSGYSMHLLGQKKETNNVTENKIEEGVTE